MSGGKTSDEDPGRTHCGMSTSQRIRRQNTKAMKMRKLLGRAASIHMAFGLRVQLYDGRLRSLQFLLVQPPVLFPWGSTPKGVVASSSSKGVDSQTVCMQFSSLLLRPVGRRMLQAWTDMRRRTFLNAAEHGSFWPTLVKSQTQTDFLSPTTVSIRYS